MYKQMLTALLVIGGSMPGYAAEHVEAPQPDKPGAKQVLRELKEGNERFREGKPLGTHRDMERVALAAKSDQGLYAKATVLSCSDSRVPVELIFDAGIMDLFVIRVAGNVADTDETGSIEYGLAHVNTPVLVVLGHTGCGAVKAVTQAAEGHGHPLEKNIPPLVDNIQPPVERAIHDHPGAEESEIVGFAVEENVWQSVHDLFLSSAAIRNLVAQEKVKVVGAVYDLPTGEVHWLNEAKPAQILAEVNKDPKRSTEAMAGEH